MVGIYNDKVYYAKRVEDTVELTDDEGRLLTVSADKVTIVTPGVTKEFILAGNATFTVERPDGTHTTYNVQKHKTELVYFVRTLVGPENTKDYAYTGLLNLESGGVRATAKSKVTDNRLAIVDRVLRRVWSDELMVVLNAGWKVHHSGRCGRCGRLLTTPESLLRGIGPVCADMGANS